MKALAKMQKGHDLITFKLFSFAQNESITFSVNCPLMEQKAERYKIMITGNHEG